MSSVLDNTASLAIRELQAEIQSHAASGTALPVTHLRLIADRLRSIGSLVDLMEQELAVHRLGEQGRAAFSVIEAAAGELLSEQPARVEDGNVLHLDFSGRK
ncbi:hypothetical protein [Ensifer sp. B1-9]|uniref:hypothetical protein n=1 Tax=Ensifer sp. B1-9 TaxID=3141455 RepID=UPI003D24E97A